MDVGAGSGILSLFAAQVGQLGVSRGSEQTKGCGGLCVWARQLVGSRGPAAKEPEL